MTKKKLGVLRTDYHSLLYAACFDHYNREEYRKCRAQLYIFENTAEGDYDQINFGDSLSTDIHLHADATSIPVEAIPRKDTEITGCWNIPIDTVQLSKEQFGKAFNCKVYDTLEEMAVPGLFDGVLIGNCSFQAEDHVAYALPFIKAGIPLFIDKPFADNAAKAKIILDAAREYDTPIFCTSILLFSTPNQNLKKEEIGDPRFIVSTIGSTLDQRNSSVHILSNCLGAMMWLKEGKYEVESVRYIGTPDWKLSEEQYQEKYGENSRQVEAYQVLFTDGTVGILNCKGFGMYAFRLDVYGTKGTSTEYVVEDTMRNPILRIASEFAEMLDTKIPPLHYDRIFEFVAALDAAKVSRDEGGRAVTIKEIADSVGYELHRPMKTKF